MFLFLSFLLLMSFPANAQVILLDQPACFNVINQEDQRVFGHVETNRNTEGHRHRSEFRLDPGESVQACTMGPVYPDARVKLVIKSWFPLYECLTRVSQDVIIKRQLLPNGEYKKNEQGYTIWVECY